MKFTFRTLVNQHHKHVYSLAYRILADNNEAEDVTQEVYERLWRHIQNVRENEARAWLTTVAKNICFDRLRKRREHVELCPDSHIAQSADEPAHATTTLCISGWLRQAIEELNEPYRSLIFMLDVRELSVREAAQLTELNENQVKVYSHRARKQLRALLQETEQ